jgi:hypothetical protein
MRHTRARLLKTAIGKNGAKPLPPS